MRHHQFFENLAASLNQIEVPVGGRIKRTRIKGADFVQWSSQEAAVLGNKGFYAGGRRDGNWGSERGLRDAMRREHRAPT